MQFHTHIQTQVTQVTSTQSEMAQNENSLATYAGWVFKEGSLVKSWKKRFLVVKRAELAYYKNTEQENKAQILGAMTVARVERVPDITNGLLIVSVEGRQLKIFTDTQKECDKCFNAIAQYASGQRGGSAVTPLPDFGSDKITHVGWLEKEGQHFKTWKKRYFVLEENVLSYTAQIGSPSLGKARVIAARRDLSRPNTLVVMMEGGRELKIGGKTEAEIHEWHKAMRRAIQRHGGGHRDHLTSPANASQSHRSPAYRSPAHLGPPPAYASRSPASSNYAQTSPAARGVGGSLAYHPEIGSQEHSPLFGSLPEPDRDTSASSEPTAAALNAEQARNIAARQNRDMYASFRRHIILEPTPDNSTSFIECEPEKKEPAAKPYSPKAPGTNTILQMRLEDQLLLEELEEERQEALQKEKALLEPTAKDAAVDGPCCCILM